MFTLHAHAYGHLTGMVTFQHGHGRVFDVIIYLVMFQPLLHK